MRTVACLALLLALAASLAAQQKRRESIKWRRVYTYSDAVIQMEEAYLSLSSSRRVRFRTVFQKALPLRGRPDVRYKVIVEDMELNCSAREYRVAETVFLDKKGRARRTGFPAATWTARTPSIRRPSRWTKTLGKSTGRRFAAGPR